MSRAPRLVVALAAAVVLLAGCSSAVEVRVPDRGADAACASAASRWPDELAGHAVVETEPSDPAVRAWGDPAIIARCGVPAIPPTTEQCIVVDEIDWVAEDLDDGTRLTTFGRDPAIEVLVPEDYGPAPLLLPSLSDAAAALPRNDLACS